MAKNGVKFDVQGFAKRLHERIRRADIQDPDNRSALVRIGMLLESQAKLNARRKAIADTGLLINSIKYDIVDKNGGAVIQVGTPGIKYGMINEFGGPFTDEMRKAMFASFRDRGKGKRASKGVIVGKQWLPRPYIRPALVQQRDRIIDILRGNA